MKVIFDTETTGLIPGQDEVIQFAAIDENGNILLNAFIRPERVLSFPGASEVHGLTYENLKDCPVFEHYKDQIQSIFDHCDEIITYNGRFDISMLQPYGIKFRKDIKRNDVMFMFAPIYGKYDKKYKSFRWQPLEKCADYFGYQFKSHDALEDAKATLFCYKKITAIKKK